ncbi:Unannotated [Lentimonas sp. CC4]|nr:Unannotated [Lentimonas sp. CC4]CAA6687034.1 Unannotated [Lentimonas sp. CC6]CAA7076193.1 Unannotated [Lentimonas sp. CC4]CAA7171159.1 Unannotated [Lentimonas sp. CC21]CAA7182740.1 Unannotated [Lentimonas sp. CC8]
MIGKPHIHLLLLSATNVFFTYLFLNLIPRMEHYWASLLDGAAYPKLALLTFEYGSLGTLLFLTISLVTLAFSFINRKKDNQQAWSSLFAACALTELLYFTAISLGLMLPALAISTELTG